MNILIYDVIQQSSAPEELKSPALAEVIYISPSLDITLDEECEINCIGIGYCNVSQLSIEINGDTINIDYTESGLYLLNKTYNTTLIKINNNCRLGRFAAGIACDIPTSIAKEPAFASTIEPRVTLSGQVIKGRGGYNYRAVSLDSRYKINQKIMDEIVKARKYIGEGFPFFIDFTTEAYKLPFDKLYANDLNQNYLSFESGVRYFLYSRRWELEERF